MLYTRKSLAFVWLITLGLIALTGSGAVAGSWLLLLVAIALLTPALILRSPRPIGVTMPRSERTAIATDQRDRSPSDVRNDDVSGWENEGGAALMHAGSGRPHEPAHRAL